MAPKLFGGDAKSPVEGQGVALQDQAVALKNTRISRVGEDILLESEVDGSVYGNR